MCSKCSRETTRRPKNAENPDLDSAIMDRVEEYRRKIDGYMMRHRIKPGITGWAQVNGWRGETDTLEKMEKRVHYDLEYIRNWSVWLDIKIMILTVTRGFTGKNVY